MSAGGPAALRKQTPPAHASAAFKTCLMARKQAPRAGGRQLCLGQMRLHACLQQKTRGPDCRTSALARDCARSPAPETVSMTARRRATRRHNKTIKRGAPYPRREWQAHLRIAGGSRRHGVRAAQRGVGPPARITPWQAVGSSARGAAGFSPVGM